MLSIFLEEEIKNWKTKEDIIKTLHEKKFLEEIVYQFGLFSMSIFHNSYIACGKRVEHIAKLLSRLDNKAFAIANKNEIITTQEILNPILICDFLKKGEQIQEAIEGLKKIGVEPKAILAIYDDMYIEHKQKLYKYPFYALVTKKLH